jgi:prepilin-type N-terminal cleavage/methylation domain-containing protein
MLIFLRKHFSKRPRGFTLIELLVVISIIVVITAVLLLRQSQLNSSTLLRSLAYSIALSVRQAQTYGTTVYGSSIFTQVPCEAGEGTYSAGSCFTSGYGIGVISGDNKHYFLFGDLDSDGTYDTGEEIHTYTLGSGFTISKFCVIPLGGGSEVCGPSGLSKLSVLFRRPNPDACFSTNIASGACGTGPQIYEKMYIEVTSVAGDYRRVTANVTGQIAVCPLNTPSC